VSFADQLRFLCFLVCAWTSFSCRIGLDQNVRLFVFKMCASRLYVPVVCIKTNHENMIPIDFDSATMTQRDMSQEDLFKLLTSSANMTSQLVDVLRRQQQAISTAQNQHGIQFSQRKDSTYQSGSSYDPDDNMSWSVASTQSIEASRTSASSATYRVSNFPQSSLASVSSPIGVEPHTMRRNVQLMNQVCERIVLGR